MIMSPHDVEVVFRSALIRVATCLGIDDIDFKGNAELYEEISTTRTDLMTDLDAFFEAYGNWYKYHYDRRDRDLTISEKSDLQRLIHERNMSRATLIEKLKQRGC